MIACYAAGEGGARRAARRGAVVVVVDAFRASTTIAVLVSRGARVVPVASIEEAATVRADFRAGERGSAKVAGFDFGNSPVEILAAGVPSGSVVALSTTNGTRIIEAAEGAAAIFAGTFVNASAIAEALILEPEDPEVVVVGCGWEGHRASEDESGAGAILSRLQGKGVRLDARASRIVELYRRRSERDLKTNSAARRLQRLGYEKDLDFCLAEDTISVAPQLIDGAFAKSPAADRL